MNLRTLSSIRSVSIASGPSRAQIRSNALEALAALQGDATPDVSVLATAVIEAEASLPATTLATTKGWLSIAAACEATRGIAACNVCDMAAASVTIDFFDGDGTQAPTLVASVPCSQIAEASSTKWLPLLDQLSADGELVNLGLLSLAQQSEQVQTLVAEGVDLEALTVGFSRP